MREENPIKHTIEALVKRNIFIVWASYKKLDYVKHWQTISPGIEREEVNLDFRVGGLFSWRNRALDGSLEFEEVGIFTKIIAHKVIEYVLNSRTYRVEFESTPEGVLIRMIFDANCRWPIHTQRMEKRDMQLNLSWIAKVIEGYYVR